MVIKEADLEIGCRQPTSITTITMVEYIVPSMRITFFHVFQWQLWELFNWWLVEVPYWLKRGCFMVILGIFPCKVKTIIFMWRGSCKVASTHVSWDWNKHWRSILSQPDVGQTEGWPDGQQPGGGTRQGAGWMGPDGSRNQMGQGWGYTGAKARWVWEWVGVRGPYLVHKPPICYPTPFLVLPSPIWYTIISFWYPIPLSGIWYTIPLSSTPSQIGVPLH